MNIVLEKISEITALCRKLKVKRLFVFGSVLRGDFREDSDIDFEVEFAVENIDNLYHNFSDLYDGLQNLFGRKIDLVDSKGVRNPFFKSELEKTRQLIYG